MSCERTCRSSLMEWNLSEQLNTPRRRGWRVMAVTGGMVFVALCLLGALPLVIDLPYSAPHNSGTVIANKIELVPTQGPAEQEVTLSARDLNAGVSAPRLPYLRVMVRFAG
jgi:hypothetical protein